MERYNPFISDRYRTTCSCGDRFVTTYKPHFENDGTMILKKSGRHDLYEEIQSHKASTDINTIIDRFTISGDESLFQVRQAYYGDFSEMPKTYAEMFQRVVDAENLFNGLPANIKEQFNNNLSEFLSQFGSEKFMKVFDPGQAKSDDQKPFEKVEAQNE